MRTGKQGRIPFLRVFLAWLAHCLVRGRASMTPAYSAVAVPVFAVRSGRPARDK